VRRAGNIDQRRTPTVFHPYLMGIGLLCVLAAIVGGGVSLAGQQIPALKSVFREVLLGAVGGVLILASFRLRPDDGGRSRPHNPTSEPADVGNRLADGPAATEATRATRRRQSRVQLWNDDVDVGRIGGEVTTTNPADVLTLVNLVDAEMNAREFRPRTALRARLVLQELLSNVRKHSDNASAWLEVTLQIEPIRVVTVTVADSGPGVPVEAFRQSVKRFSGDREHGLLLIQRLSDTVLLEAPDQAPPTMPYAVSCDLYEPRLPDSVLLEFPFVTPVILHFASPTAYWLGSECSYIDPWRGTPIPTFADLLTDAVTEKDFPIVNLYFGHMPRDTVLGVHITGYDIATEWPDARSPRWWLLAALESYFRPSFEKKTVVLLAADTRNEPIDDARRLSSRWDLPCFQSDDECRAFLESYNRSDSG
jgi:anti-sigma regulatory factor (Ser/Thr protein kinase)